jgi:hypothetical protein
MVVRESANVTLTCKATGYPEPYVMWRREDGKDINYNGENGKGTCIMLRCTVMFSQQLVRRESDNILVVTSETLGSRIVCRLLNIRADLCARIHINKDSKPLSLSDGQWELAVLIPDPMPLHGLVFNLSIATT